MRCCAGSGAEPWLQAPRSAALGSPSTAAMDRRQPPQGARRLEMLRQKRNALRTRGEEAASWVGPHGSAGAGAGRQVSDAAAMSAAQRRRAAAAYALSSSSSSSDSEEAGAAGAGAPAPTEQEITAKLFAKLGIKHGGPRGGSAGFDSDSSWASSPERSRLIKAGGSTPAGAAGAAGHGEQGQQDLERARSTIAALQQELAAARAQADSTQQQLRAAQEYAQGLEGQLHAAERQVAELREEVAGAAGAGQPANGWAIDWPLPADGEAGDSSAHSRAGSVPAGEEVAALAEANRQLQEQVEVLGCQLSAAAEWQQEVHSMQGELASMQAAVADSEAARQQAEAELGCLLQQREAELMEATARLAAAQAQLAALQGVDISAEGGALQEGVGAGAGGLGGVQRRPAAELLAEFAVSHAQVTAALAEAAALLA